MQNSYTSTRGKSWIEDLEHKKLEELASEVIDNPMKLSIYKDMILHIFHSLDFIKKIELPEVLDE